MKNQMNFHKLLLLLISVVSLSACSKKEEGTNIGRDTATMNPTIAWAQSANISANGVVYASESQQSLFQDAVKGYVEAMLHPDNLGFVSATASGGTGFYFGARVELQTGVLNSAGNASQVNVKSDSKMYIEVRDEYTGRADASGQTVPAITRGFVQASGYVQGNRAYLKFTDKYGSVEMDGTFNGSTFIGTFAYDNAMSYDGVAPTAAGNLGTFQVPTCQFFRCQ